MTREFSVDDPFAQQENHKEARDGLTLTTYRKSFAVNTKTFNTDSTIHPQYSVIYGDTSAGAITLTLPLLSYWSANKSPILIIHNTGAVNNLTISNNAGDSIDYVAGSIVLGPRAIVSYVGDVANLNWNTF